LKIGIAQLPDIVAESSHLPAGDKGSCWQTAWLSLDNDVCQQLLDRDQQQEGVKPDSDQDWTVESEEQSKHLGRIAEFEMHSIII